MTFIRDIEKEPYRFDLFSALRVFERSNPDKPLIGDSAILEEEFVELAQDPFVEFPASNISNFENEPGSPHRITTRYLGFFGPQGALPLSTTIEAKDWMDREDDAFVRFTEIFSTRFQQLFFRTWASSRPIVHMDRPDQNQFMRYMGAFIGIGTSPYFERDSVADIAKIPYAGMISPTIKSASRLRKFIKGALGVEVEIKERIPSWLVFEAEDFTRVGESGSTLGGGMFLGQKALTINEKIRISIKTKDLQTYEDFLPTGKSFEKLSDLISFYIGHRLEFEVELALLANVAPSVELGKSGKLGWTSWISNEKKDIDANEYLRDARFMPRAL